MNLDEIGKSIEERGNRYGEVKPMSVRRFSWEVHKLLFKVAIFAGIVAAVAHHGH